MKAVYVNKLNEEPKMFIVSDNSYDKFIGLVKLLSGTEKVREFEVRMTPYYRRGHEQSFGLAQFLCTCFNGNPKQIAAILQS